MSKEIEEFESKFIDFLNTPKMKRFNLEGGVTFGGKEGDLFCLEPVPMISEYENEIVKRIGIPMNLLTKLIKNDYLVEEFFSEINDEMIKLGCPDYTFKRPDGKYFLNLLEGVNAVELRAYGMAKEIK